MEATNISSGAGHENILLRERNRANLKEAPFLASITEELHCLLPLPALELFHVDDREGAVHFLSFTSLPLARLFTLE